MYFLDLNKFKNISIILTKKYLIFISKNGIINLNTNFYNLLINDNKIYFNFSSNKKLNNDNNFKYFFTNINDNNNKISVKLLNYSLNYLNNFYNTLYYLYYNYSINIVLKGIGYKFILENNNLLKIRVGYSHFINYTLDSNIFAYLPNQTTLILYGNNKFLLSKIGANIKLLKKTNLYKGTGIFYNNEYISLKKKNNNKNKNVK